MLSPLVSFIIPFFNSGETIQETIDSIFNQSYENFDVWIINDGSTEINAIEKLKEFESNPQINILHQENEGPSIARNNAIKKSNAKYIIPLDADDKITEHAIKNGLPFLLENENLGVVYGNLNYFGVENYLKIQEPFEIKKQILWNQVAICCLIKKEVFESVEYYDEYLSKLGLEDWEFWIRVYEQGWHFKEMDETLFEIRVSVNSRTFQVANKNIDAIKEYVYKKHAVILAKEFNNLFYAFKMLKEMPDFRVGNWILSPYRMIKNKLKKNE